MRVWTRVPDAVLHEQFWRLGGAPMLPHVHVALPGLALFDRGEWWRKCRECRAWVPVVGRAST